MPAELTKDAIDLGICVADIERSLAFYRDVLGFDVQRTMPMPRVGSIHFLRCGRTALKLVAPDVPPDPGPRAPLDRLTGFRYLTISVGNIDALVAECEQAGVPVLTPVTELLPGVRIAIVADPDGNPVEFLGT